MAPIADLDSSLLFDSISSIGRSKALLSPLYCIAAQRKGARDWI
jgi:hypothetical protein